MLELNTHKKRFEFQRETYRKKLPHLLKVQNLDQLGPLSLGGRVRSTISSCLEPGRVEKNNDKLMMFECQLMSKNKGIGTIVHVKIRKEY